ncbi:MAG: hypothetical protein JXJ04_15560, partial [Spirochaetales bacterium]|nr:hypothetical protein [Spirochaetales bacterium]
EIIKKLESENVFAGNLKAFLDAMPTSSSGGIALLSPSAAIGTWQGHIVIDNETVLHKGIIAMRESVQKELSCDNLKKEERDFLTSLDIAYEGILIYAGRLGEAIRNKAEAEHDPAKKKNYMTMFEAVSRVPAYPAETFYQAVQSFWIIKTVVGLSVPFNAHGLGRLDQIFYPFYSRDIENKTITRDEAREILEELLIKSMSHNMRPYSNYISDFSHRFDGSEAVTIGGLTGDGRDATNELTYLILEAAYRSKTVINIVVRVHKNTPDELHLLISDLLYNKISNVSILNDDVCIKALVNYGYILEDAREYAAISCADICTPGKSGAIGASSILLCNLLDTTLRNGMSATLLGDISDAGLKTGEILTFKTFDDLLTAFFKQFVYTLTLIDKGVDIRDRVYAAQLPAPLISAFTPSTLRKKKDVTAGGEDYNVEFIILMNSIANLVDSLFVIKQLVFEEKCFSLSELCKAIDNNYHGYDELHEKIVNYHMKWGNGHPVIDQFAQEITSRFVDEIKKHKNFRGGPFVPSIVSMITHTISGRLGIATPDGRKAARPYAAGCSPYNVEKSGPTGVFRSVAALDFNNILECSLNIKLHPSSIGKNIESRKKWISLLKTYCNLGGMQLQPTIVSHQDLLAAQKDPSAYSDLIVKVGGYSVYFTELGRELQEEIISRTEHSGL